MATALVIVTAVVAVVAVAWFFVARNPEATAGHVGEPRRPSQSHFAPGDGGTEDQAVPRPGEPGPRRRP